MITTNKTIEIPLSKTKILLVIIGCLLFVILAIWELFIRANQSEYPPIIIKIIFILGLCFFGLGLILGIIKLFDKRAGVIIDDNGIQDNTSISGGRFISWANISSFKIIQIMSRRILLIFINNSEEMISNESKWKQKIFRHSEKIYGTPISIGSGTLKINFDKLLQLLIDRQRSLRKLDSY